MAFAKQVQLLGDQRLYQIAPDLKKYTLLDLNFTKKNNGNFELVQPLNNIEEANVIKAQLKLVINSDFSSFKMSVVDGKGLRKLNLFKGDQYKVEREQLNFVLRHLMTRQVIEIVK